MKLIFWGRQCRHISFSRCKAILKRGSRANLVHLDRLWSPASANGTVSDGLTHPSWSPACLTTVVLTLSLVWYTHSVMDSRQYSLWQDREISLHCSQACYFLAAGDTPFIQGRVIQYPDHCMGPTWTISLNMPHKCRFPYTAFTIFKSPYKQLQHQQSLTKWAQSNKRAHTQCASRVKWYILWEKVQPSDKCYNVVPFFSLCVKC